jgi:hypothetical protein
VAAATGFHANLTGGKFRKIRHYFFATELFADHDLAMRIDPMHLKHLLCHI